MQTLEQTPGKMLTVNSAGPVLVNGAQQDFLLLYDIYSGALYGVIIKMVKSKNKAGQILIQTFNQAHKEAYSYDKEKVSLFIWLLRIAIQLVISQKKHEDVARIKDNIISVFTEDNGDSAK